MRTRHSAGSERTGRHEKKRSRAAWHWWAWAAPLPVVLLNFIAGGHVAVDVQPAEAPVSVSPAYVVKSELADQSIVYPADYFAIEREQIAGAGYFIPAPAFNRLSPLPIVGRAAPKAVGDRVP